MYLLLKNLSLVLLVSLMLACTSCQHQPDYGKVDHGFAALAWSLVIFCKTAETIEPPKRAFYNPTMWYNLKPFAGVSDGRTMKQRHRQPMPPRSPPGTRGQRATSRGRHPAAPRPLCEDSRRIRILISWGLANTGEQPGSSFHCSRLRPPSSTALRHLFWHRLSDPLEPLRAALLLALVQRVVPARREPRLPNGSPSPVSSRSLRLRRYCAHE